MRATLLRARPPWLVRFLDRLLLDGQLRVLQPWAFLPGPLLLLAALAFPFRWLYFLAYVYLLLLLACYLWVRLLVSHIELERDLRTSWAEVGDELLEEWALINHARIPLLWLDIDDSSTVPGYNARRVAAGGPSEEHRWGTSARCIRRGVYALGPSVLRIGDPLGIFGAEWSHGSARRIVIYPALMRLPDMRPPPGRSGGLARADLLQQAVTPSVGGVREYVPGDMPSRIHWPTVARTGRLMVKEFDQERAGALWILLDLWSGSYPEERHAEQRSLAAPPDAHYGQSSLVADQQTPRPDTPLELAIVLAGSLAAQALAGGRAVGLIANDGRPRIVIPGQGPQQLWRILGELVDAQATGAAAPGDLLRRGPGSFVARAPGAALALITPDLGGEWIGALAGWQAGHGGGALAILVGGAGARADDLQGRLASAGVGAHLFRVGDDLPLLHPPRPRPVTRVSPLGKIRVGGA
jgi:uncharacterized protein (DUF58 family)